MEQQGKLKISLREKNQCFVTGINEPAILENHLIEKDAYTQGALDALELVGIAIKELPDVKYSDVIKLDDVYAILNEIELSVSEDRAYSVLPFKLGYLGLHLIK